MNLTGELLAFRLPDQSTGWVTNFHINLIDKYRQAVSTYPQLHFEIRSDAYDNHGHKLTEYCSIWCTLGTRDWTNDQASVRGFWNIITALRDE